MIIEELKIFGKIYTDLDTLVRDIFDWWISDCLPSLLEDFDSEEVYEINNWWASERGVYLNYESIDFSGIPIDFPLLPFEVLVNGTWKEYLTDEVKKELSLWDS